MAEWRGTQESANHPPSSTPTLIFFAHLFSDDVKSEASFLPFFLMEIYEIGSFPHFTPRAPPRLGDTTHTPLTPLITMAGMMVMDPVKKPEPTLPKSIQEYKEQYRYVEDEEALQEFFKNFKDVSGEPYMRQIADIKARKSDIFTVTVDDMLYDNGKFSSSDRMVGLAQRIENVATSYIEHISRVVDKLLLAEAEPAEGTYKKDSFDFLITKDNERVQQQGADARSAVPNQIVRRYRVHLRPSAVNNEKKQVRGLGSRCLGKLSVLSGMTVAASPVKPKVLVATYLCDTCNECIYQEVVGMSYNPVQTCPSNICKQNASRGKIFLEYRGTKFTQFQELRMQELPQFVPKGCVPRSIKVMLEGSLCGQVSPGAVVDLTGMFCIMRT